jgi:hypothetical protein
MNSAREATLNTRITSGVERPTRITYNDGMESFAASPHALDAAFSDAAATAPLKDARGNTSGPREVKEVGDDASSERSDETIPAGFVKPGPNDVLLGRRGTSSVASLFCQSHTDRVGHSNSQR